MLNPPAADQKVRVCVCSEPRHPVDPRRAGWCSNCLSKIESLTTDETVDAFFTRLAESLFVYDPFGELLTSPSFDAFRDHCVQRERAGRDTFGNRFMSRDNIEECEEELVDAALYMTLDNLRHELTEGEDRDVDLVLTVAFHAFKSYEAALRLKAKRSGAP